MNPAALIGRNMSLLYPDFLQIFVISPHVTHAIAQDLLKDAIDYAKGRACFRSGEIRILDSSGAVVRIIPFDETERRL